MSNTTLIKVLIHLLEETGETISHIVSEAQNYPRGNTKEAMKCC